MQPYHAADDGRWCDKRIGLQRSKSAYAFRSLLDGGAALAFGSDWTVAPLNPLCGIKAAVTRQTLDGRHPAAGSPSRRSPPMKPCARTRSAPRMRSFAESAKGSIAVGKLADLVMLDRDIFTGEPAEIDKAQVVLTMTDGRVVYDSGR